MGALVEPNATAWIVGIASAAGGAWAIYEGNSQANAAKTAFQFVVRMRSTSGEQQVYVSRDEAHVRRIVSALNTAISS